LGVKEGTECEGTGCERIKVLGRVKHLGVNEGTGPYAEGSGAVYRQRGHPSPVRIKALGSVENVEPEADDNQQSQDAFLGRCPSSVACS
jgi:hypothetical protein